jgi:aromatic ring-opening dioxygenase LigB subunit
MPIVCAAIAPHGGLILPEYFGSEPLAAKSRAGMEELGRRFAAARPETIFVVTAHGIAIEDGFAVSGGHLAEGDLGRLGGVHQEFEVDQDLARAIVEESRRAGLPAALVSTRGTGRGARVPLDWGCTIPLHFMGERWDPKPKVVVAGICRGGLSLSQHLAFGRAVGQAAARSDRRIGYIASTDLAHTHRTQGSFTFNPAAAISDAWMREVIQADDLTRLLDADMDQADRAWTEGIWEILTLAGARELTPMRGGEILSYEVPTYFGMLCAAFTIL